jgi:hypothetical protein
MKGGSRYNEIPIYESSGNKNNPFKTKNENKINIEKRLEKRITEKKVVLKNKDSSNPFETNEEKKINNIRNYKSKKYDKGAKRYDKGSKKFNNKDDINSKFATNNYKKKFPKSQGVIHPKNNMIQMNNQDNLIEFKVSNDLLRSSKKAVPMYKEAYPSPYIPLDYKPDVDLRERPNFREVIDKGGYPYTSGRLGSAGDNYKHPWNFTPNNVPVMNINKISLPNPSGEHIRISGIYEDTLPLDFDTSKFSSIKQRTVMFDYIRNILIKQGDGEDIDIRDGANSRRNTNLLSYLKFLDLNPYHYDRYTNNPYKTLPDRMLLYRSCYPIRFNARNNISFCARNSIGMNVRFYDVTVGELKTKSSGLEGNKFDLWREIYYYEYVREQIIKKGICPHFALLYCYYLSTNAGIRFDKLKQLKEDYKRNNYNHLTKMQEKELNDKYKKIVAEQLGIDYDKSRNTHDMSRYLENEFKQNRERRREESITGTIGTLHTEIFPNGTMVYKKYEKNNNRDNIPLRQSAKDNYNNKHAGTNFNIEDLDINKSSRICLIALTEAPNYNLFNWATKTYKKELLNPVHTMINTGYHSEEVWYSIIFQLLVSLHVMWENEIAFSNLTIEDNIYIKDLKTNDQSIGYWKYKINGCNYYLPNFGYLLLVDSLYKDLESTNNTMKENKNERKYKIYGRIDMEYETEDEIKNKKNRDKFVETSYNNLKNVLNPNNFGKTFTSLGGTKPSIKIISLLENIYNDINKDNSDEKGNTIKYIEKYMRMYLNNRLGTSLLSSEIEHIDEDITYTSNRKGDLVPYKFKNGYIWGMFLESIETNSVKILTKKSKNSKEMIEKVIARGNVKENISNNEVQQDYKPPHNLSESEILETYFIS